jgi:ferric-dicitrate binding protein FerR (iron transport regulator)
MNRVRTAGFVALAVLSICMVELVGAQARQIGTAQNATGMLVIVRADGVQEHLQGKGALPLYEGDVLKTEIACRALVEIAEGIQVALNEQTAFKILVRWEKYKGTTPIIRLMRGEVWVQTMNGSSPLQVETPIANVSVEQSEFDLKVTEDGQSALTVLQGVAEFGTPFDTCSVLAPNVTSGVHGNPCKKLPTIPEGAQATTWMNSLK